MNGFRILKVGLALTVTLNASCYVFRCTETRTDETGLSQASVSSEAAILFAKELLVHDYELDKFETSAEELDDVWKISFSKNTKLGPVVFVSKRTGKIIFVVHSK